jgi:hypothetical protein
MPLYVRRDGREARARKEEALKLDAERRMKRIEIKGSQSESIKEAVKAMANIHTVRIGVGKPAEDPGEGYDTPSYDKGRRCWISHIKEQTVRGGDKEWKIWCLESGAWQTKEEWEQG